MAVLLRFVERRTFGQIASVLRLTEDAARKRVERALDKLRSILARRGIDSSAAALAATLTTNAVTAAPSGFATAVAGAAVTGAAAGSGGLTIFTLMSMTKIQFGIAAAIIVASAGGILVLRGRNAALDRELTALRQHYGRLQARSAEPTVAAADTTVATQAPAPAIAPTVDRSVQPTANRLKGAELALAKQRDRRLAELDQQYPKLYSILRLTPEQAAQLRSLLAINIQRNTDLLAAAVSQSGKLDDVAQKAADQMSNLELRAMLQATFDDAVAQTVLRFSETLPMRANVEKFAIRLLYSDLPLSESQAEQLVNIVHNNRVPPRIARPAGPDGGPETDPVKVAAYEAKANSIQSQAEAASRAPPMAALLLQPPWLPSASFSPVPTFLTSTKPSPSCAPTCALAPRHHGQGLRQRRHPHLCAPTRRAPRHRPTSAQNYSTALRRTSLSRTSPHRKPLRPPQGLPPHRHTLRETSHHFAAMLSLAGILVWLKL